MRVVRDGGTHRLEGSGAEIALANRFLEQLSTRAFSAATVRTYAFHVLSFLRFCSENDLSIASVRPTDFYEFLDWLGHRRRPTNTIIPLRRPSAAAATMNQRIAAVRALFDYAVLAGVREENPVPSAVPLERSSCQANAVYLVTSPRVEREQAGALCANRGAFPKHSIPTRSLPSSETSTPTATEQWRSPCFSVGFAPVKCARCFSSTSTKDCAGCVSWARATKSGSCPSTGHSSQSSWPICDSSDRPDALLRSALSCCEVRLGASRSPKRECGESSALTGHAWVRLVCVRTASATLTAPSSPPPASTYLSFAELDGPR